MEIDMVMKRSTKMEIGRHLEREMEMETEMEMMKEMKIDIDIKEYLSICVYPHIYDIYARKHARPLHAHIDRHMDRIRTKI